MRPVYPVYHHYPLIVEHKAVNGFPNSGTRFSRYFLLRDVVSPSVASVGVGTACDSPDAVAGKLHVVPHEFYVG